jgi:hypothetical protein
MLSSCLAMPREGRLEQVFHIFAYLKGKHNTEMIFDPSIPDVDESLFPKRIGLALFMQQVIVN